MRLDVVDANQRNVQRLGEALRGVKPHNQRRRKPRPVCDGDRINRLIVQLLELRNRLSDDLRDLLNMRPACDFGHDAAIGLMQRNLRVDNVGQHLATVPHDRRRRLIATCLYA